MYFQPNEDDEIDAEYQQVEEKTLEESPQKVE